MKFNFFERWPEGIDRSSLSTSPVLATPPEGFSSGVSWRKDNLWKAIDKDRAIANRIDTNRNKRGRRSVQSCPNSLEDYNCDNQWDRTPDAMLVNKTSAFDYLKLRQYTTPPYFFSCLESPTNTVCRLYSYALQMIIKYILPSCTTPLKIQTNLLTQKRPTHKQTAQISYYTLKSPAIRRRN